jgi:hypothetical protein
MTVPADTIGTSVPAGDTTTMCENASIHNPTAKLTQHIDFVRKNEISEGSFSRET